MSPKAQRVAIAETCGWTQVTASGPYGVLIGLHATAGDCRILDYLNDLNAMHEAEKVLSTAEQQSAFKGYLCSAIHSLCGTGDFSYIHATAVQRAEAFLRTVGKWDDSL